MIRFVAIMAMLGLASGRRLQQGEAVCAEGFVMDYYCLNRGRMLDNGLDPLVQPEEHTVHCLVDVDICRSSGFVILNDPDDGESRYSLGYALDADGTMTITRLARQIGDRCSTCFGGGTLVKGMRAGVLGTVVDGDVEPALISVESVEYVGPDDDAFCANRLQVDPSTAEPTISPTTTPTMAPTQAPTSTPTMTSTTQEPTPGITTLEPTLLPTESPTLADAASDSPSDAPSDAPSDTPSDIPSASPSTMLSPRNGDDVCAVGYIIDKFCLDLGFLLDDNDVNPLEQPYLHSIHCLVDVPSCVNSNYTILSEPLSGETLYNVAYQFDTSGTLRLAEMARQVGETGYCTSCRGGDGGWKFGFRVGVKGTILDANMTPPLIQLVDASYSLDFCKPDYVPPPEDETTETPVFPEADETDVPTVTPAVSTDREVATEAPAESPTRLVASGGCRTISRTVLLVMATATLMFLSIV